jgi:type I restriction enzyme, S subunit
MTMTPIQIKQGWKEVRLGEIISHISRGVSPKYSENNEGITVINQKCIRNNKISFDQARLHDKSKNFSQNKIVKKFDILINSTGVGTLGRLAQNTNNFDFIVDSHITILRLLENENINPEYIGFNLRHQENFIESLGKGATGQTELSKEDLKEIQITLPPLPIQDKIAEVLSNYDDLIEGNNRRIQILESQAAKIYTEWFVHYRYPGSENVPLIDSSTKYGMIPQDWEVRSLSEITSIITKGTTPTTIGKNFCVSGVNYLKIETIGSHGEILNDKFTFISKETHELLKRSKLEEFDILFSIAGAIGRTILINKSILPANTNQALAIIRLLDKRYIYYGYQIVSSKLFLNFSTERIVQTAQANVSLAVIGSAKLLIPNIQTISLYNEIIKPIFSSIENLKNQNQNLKKSRDLLIPQLVGGLLEV